MQDRFSVYVIKSEARAPAMGNMLIRHPALCVEEFFSNPDLARSRMRELAMERAKDEIARGRHSPYSASWLNAIPDLRPTANDAQVTTAEGFVVRFYIEEAVVV